MILGLPLAIWFGFLTIISLFITAIFGIAFHVYRKNVFGYHKFFAFLTITLAIVHGILAFMFYFLGIVL